MSRPTFGLAVRAMIFFHSAKPPLSPSFYPHSLVSEIRSVLGGCSRFSRRCYLISVLSSHLFGGNWAPGVSRSHLDSAVELGCSDQNFLGHGTHGLLAIAQWFAYLAAHPQPIEQYRQLSRHGQHCSFLGVFPSSLGKLPSPSPQMMGMLADVGVSAPVSVLVSVGSAI
jgi:hypothetical protein